MACSRVDERDTLNIEKKLLEGSQPHLIVTGKDLTSRQTPALHPEIERCIAFLVDTLYKFKHSSTVTSASKPITFGAKSNSKMATNSNEKMEVAEFSTSAKGQTALNLSKKKTAAHFAEYFAAHFG